MALLKEHGGRARWQQIALSLTMALALTIGSAAAVLHVTPGNAYANTPSGSVTMSVPAGGSGYGGWRASDDYLNLSTTPTTIATGFCQISGFDWTRGGGGHFDSRVVRSCVSNTFYSTGSSYWEPVGSYSLDGKQKLGACRGGKNLETSYTCADYSEPGYTVTSISVNSTTCARTWQLNSPGSTTYYTGGDPTSCTS